MRRRSKRSRGIRRRIIASSLLLCAAALVGWLLVRCSERPAAPQERAALPVASHAPVPAAAPWSPAERAALARAMRAAFAPALDGADRWSIAVLAADGTPLYGDRADRAASPASVLKLVVAATALDELGPYFRYSTLLAARGAVDSGGTLPGDLWLVGSGDPSLRSKDLRAGVASLWSAGLRHVEGGIAVDASAIGGREINPHWDPDDANEDFQAPVSGISLDGDTVEFDVTGSGPGQAAQVRIVPPSDDVWASGSIASGSGDSVVIAATQTPNAFALGGEIPQGVTEKFWVPVHDMPRYAGAVLARILAAAGITTGAPPSVAKVPFDSIALWDHRSAPLRVLERHMLFASDNHYAEQLLRTVGLEDGASANTPGGIAVERAFLSERGIPTPELHLVDGSGLAPANRIAASTLAGVLADAQNRGGGASLYELLPLGGRQGTLSDYDFTTALGRVRAKTGHLDDVAALAGYVNTLHHGRIVFAFIVDGSPGSPDSAYVRAVDRLAAM